MKIKVGQRVRNKPELAELYTGTSWRAKLSIPREGTIVEVPLFAATHGSGTVLVEWDSLTGSDTSVAENWRKWMHTNLIGLEEAA